MTFFLFKRPSSYLWWLILIVESILFADYLACGLEKIRSHLEVNMLTEAYLDEHTTPGVSLQEEERFLQLHSWRTLRLSSNYFRLVVKELQPQIEMDI